MAQSMHVQETPLIERLLEEQKQANNLIRRLRKEKFQSEKEKINAEIISQKQEKIIEMQSNRNIDLEAHIRKLEAHITELEAQIRELKLGKEMTNHKFKENLHRKGELCDYNCVQCCLVSICQKKLNFYPCGRHLEKIIVSHNVQSPIIDHKEEDLRCHAFMDVLKKSGIVFSENVTFDFRVDGSQWLQIRIEAWNHILSVDRSVLILGKIYSYENETVRGEGHCIICNTHTAVNGIIYDSQNEFEGITNIDEFVEYVSNDMGLEVYTVNLEKLYEIVEPHGNCLHTTCEFLNSPTHETTSL